MRPTWVIGSGGLIGGAVAAASPSSRSYGPIPWSSTDAALSELGAQLRRFSEDVGDGAWSIVWAAGAGTVAAPPEALVGETRLLAGFVQQVRAHGPSGRGAFLLSSSAGGLYAGTSSPPFTASDPPHPISPYGTAKLNQETIVAETLGDHCSVILARFSNVYGPSQDLSKPQGLISQIARAAITRQPISIYVPMDTIRDYIYADDAGRIASHWLDWAHRGTHPESGDVAVRLIASGEGTTIASLIRMASDLARRRVPVALGTHASARAQASDLRFVPSPVDGIPLETTPLIVGMKQVMLGLEADQAAHALGAVR